MIYLIGALLPHTIPRHTQGVLVDCYDLPGLQQQQLLPLQLPASITELSTTCTSMHFGHIPDYWICRLVLKGWSQNHLSMQDAAL